MGFQGLRETPISSSRSPSHAHSLWSEASERHIKPNVKDVLSTSATTDLPEPALSAM